jgi:2-oxoglutarate ferredoxin oxidoreductase subunit alpha
MVRWGTSGGFPVIALAPSSIPECYTLTAEAFRLAERFRCPVFLLTDKELNLTLNTVEVGDWDGTVSAAPAPINLAEPRPGMPYRYDPPDGVPLLVPYGEETTVRFTGSTHDERAFITKDPSAVGALNRHLAAKIEDHRDEIERVTADLEPGARTLFVSYGSTARTMREAVLRARLGGKKVSAITVQSLWPVPETALAAALASGVERVVVAELNLGQYRREIERLARSSPGLQVVGLHRVDGELLTVEQLLEALG